MGSKGTTTKLQLNHEQKRACELLWQSEAPALQLIAGAGSGKTTTLIAAIDSAVRHGYVAERIAVVTFTRKAAHELTARLASCGLTVGFCGTIHALAWRLIRESGHDYRLLVHGTAAKAQIIREIVGKSSHIPDHLLVRRDFLSASEAEEIAQRWSDYLEANSLIDFDALVPVATELESIAGIFDVLFIDEFQDTSPDQVRFALRLAPRKLFVVGDDWQSIYRFRGADVSVTRDFRRHIPTAERLFLVQNYRSTRQIVALGNRAIRLSSHFVRKKLKATQRPGKKPIVYLAHASDAATAWTDFCAWATRNPTLPRPLTVLVRTNAHRRLIEKALPEGMEVMTIHKSKGLEFDHVLVFGIAEHTMPHRENDYDEEVRILYVALTRAKRSLGFVAWEKDERRSVFLPFLLRYCRLKYL